MKKTANSEKSQNQLLAERILKTKQSAWLSLDHKEVMDFSHNYKKFLNQCKTEREVVEFAEAFAKKSGYKDIDEVKQIEKGDLLFKKSIKNFALIKFQDIEQLNVIASHIDCPRLDLKPWPLVEDSFLGLFKTHYYGGIKKYQWVNRPLAIHGVVYKAEGKRISLRLGEEEDDPVFVITDLLPHLAKDQMQKTLEKGIEGENLNLVVGNIPLDDPEILEKVKLNIMRLLNQKYGLVEEDFTSAELEIVPSEKARDSGIDNSMIAAYGQDDRICAFTSFRALLDSKTAKKTSIIVFYDKEETGSIGKTGAQSNFLKYLLEQMIFLSGKKTIFSEIAKNSSAISADVTAGFDPNFKDSFEINNSSFIGRGVSVDKYNGALGKLMGNDTSAEFYFKIRELLNKNKIPWQTGEIGKVDQGGGGTIARYIAELGFDSIDAGPALLSMHSPCELSDKADIYSTYLFFKAFFEQF